VAQKKKKSAAQRHKQQQKRQQRRHARLDKQRPKSRPAPVATLPALDDTVLDDLRVLFRGGDPASMTPDEFADTLLPPALDSADLADEPEFADIAVSPFEAAQTYITVFQEHGLGAGDIADLEEEEREETIGEALDETTQRLLTPELRQQIHTGLTALRTRLRRSNQRNELPRVAAVQMFLESDQNGQIAAALGLVQEIVRRSIGFGFQMAEALDQLRGDDETAAPLTPDALRERIEQSEFAQQLTATLGKVPGLRRFFEQQAEEMRDAGRQALFEGKLRLDLYTPAEIAGAVEVMQEAFDGDLTGFSEFDEQVGNIMPVLMPQMIEYVRGVFTTEERIARLRQRMNEVVADPDFADSPWPPFLLALRDDLMEEDALAYGLGFLLSALLGEVWPSILPPEAFQADE
jgi:hypothetical protein